MEYISGKCVPELWAFHDGNVVGHESRSDVLNSSLEKFANTAKVVGESTKPYINDIGNQLKKEWEEFSTEQGKIDLKEMLLSYKVLFIAPVFAFIISHLNDV